MAHLAWQRAELGRARSLSDRTNRRAARCAGSCDDSGLGSRYLSLRRLGVGVGVGVAPGAVGEGVGVGGAGVGVMPICS
jgi:hypothetical protein